MIKRQIYKKAHGVTIHLSVTNTFDLIHMGIPLLFSINLPKKRIINIFQLIIYKCGVNYDGGFPRIHKLK